MNPFMTLEEDNKKDVIDATTDEGLMRLANAGLPIKFKQG